VPKRFLILGLVPRTSPHLQKIDVPDTRDKPEYDEVVVSAERFVAATRSYFVAR